MSDEYKTYTAEQIDVIGPNQVNDEPRPDVIDFVLFATGPDHGDVDAVVELHPAAARAVAHDLVMFADLIEKKAAAH